MKFLRIRYEARRHFTLGVCTAAGPLHPRSPAPPDPRSSTLTLLGRWFCWKINNMCPSFKTHCNFHVFEVEGYFKCSLFEGKVWLKYQGTDLFPRVKNSASAQETDRDQDPEACHPPPSPPLGLPTPVSPQQGNPFWFLAAQLVSSD